MQKLTYILALFSLLSVSCNNKNICNISGTLDNAEDSTMLYLADFEFFNIVDSIVVVNGTIRHHN